MQQPKISAAEIAEPAKNECQKRGSNSHVLRRQILSLVRMPIPPFWQSQDNILDAILWQRFWVFFATVKPLSRIFNPTYIIVPETGVEPVRLKAKDFLAAIAFATTFDSVCGLDYTFILWNLFSVGQEPSSLYTFPVGLGSVLAFGLSEKRSPNLTPFTMDITIHVLNFNSSPLRLPDFATRAYTPILGEGFEPSHPFGYMHLKHACLPVTPSK